MPGVFLPAYIQCTLLAANIYIKLSIRNDLFHIAYIACKKFTLYMRVFVKIEIEGKYLINNRVRRFVSLKIDASF